MRRKIIAGNWKMNKTEAEAMSFLDAFLGNAQPADRTVVICPAFTALPSVSKRCKGTPVMVGAQDLYYEAQGAFTGEVSPAMVKEFCSYVVLGHSERRQYFDEKDPSINRKVQAALAVGLKPIVCVGEHLAEREAGRAESVVKKQVKGVLAGLTEDQLVSVVIAYEPVWAIGTGKVATPHVAQEMHAFIRKTVQRLFGKGAAENLPILYGGSVNPGNAKELLVQPDIDGFLVGGASLDAKSFMEIVKS